MNLMPGTRVHLALDHVDFRKGMDGLALVAQETLREDPFCGHLFVFRSRNAKRIKILYYDGTGLCLFIKRLEEGHFVWPRLRSVSDGTARKAVHLTQAQLAMLLEGLDWRNPVQTRPLRAG
ncbi:transposase [Acetobacter nitrogenifigens DSM 23921 = NBRC 105050]|uniref:Transposase n=1 Tax=Acetobacter nitrogenifigens DSM 23921 = NBRC 105050 TaxID=1120919 RepID=A0A511XEP9_9PROT|nr:IS66 family insertion sequence element accessory protein TnpB [Acetobacter nitrogenifigens]GBQ94355.1 transposase [Acetobacter nitrogenifigens DSM 23921 = NBRC 105050]GEN61424.1 transposase [Acetobacter nitrogenifigens DSM 23921 = NBRC 105050]